MNLLTFLEIHFYEKLTFKTHINSICSKLARSTTMLIKSSSPCHKNPLLFPFLFSFDLLQSNLKDQPLFTAKLPKYFPQKENYSKK